MYTYYPIPDDTKVVGKDTIPIDVPVVQETLYDYDDMDGVIDGKLYEFPGIPITVNIKEILGGKCRICKISSEILLTVHSIRNFEDNKNPSRVRRLIDEVIKRGEDPTKDFCVVCYNCDIAMTKLREIRKTQGLPELSQAELEKEVRIINY